MRASDNKYSVKDGGYILLSLKRGTLDTPFTFMGTDRNSSDLGDADQASDMKTHSDVHLFVM